jgi:hypothetical protein
LILNKGFYCETMWSLHGLLLAALVIPSVDEKAGWHWIWPLEAPPTVAGQPEQCLALLH